MSQYLDNNNRTDFGYTQSDRNVFKNFLTSHLKKNFSKMHIVTFAKLFISLHNTFFCKKANLPKLDKNVENNLKLSEYKSKIFF
jgi:hypothetical protein